MTRNLDKRIELLFPIEDRACAAKVAAALDALLRDTVKGRRLQPDGQMGDPTARRGPAALRRAGVPDPTGGARRARTNTGTVFEPLERPDRLTTRVARRVRRLRRRGATMARHDATISCVAATCLPSERLHRSLSGNPQAPTSPPHRT